MLAPLDVTEEELMPEMTGAVVSPRGAEEIVSLASLEKVLSLPEVS
jgi:hypothetical protein